MSKNKKLLDSFVHYCENAPEQRFWQCLRNWWRTEHPKIGFILTAENLDFNNNQFENIKDTFYEEN